MKNVTQFPNSSRGASLPEGVCLLPCPDRRHFDPAPVRRLYETKPLYEAEDAICSILEDMALRLDQMQRGLAQSDFGAMARPGRRLALMARQMGLLEVAASADHVRTCLSQQDGVALEAVMARLERSFDRAVNEVWNLHDI